MYSDKREPVNSPHIFWREALELPGANQMTHLKKLLESFPLMDRVPDQSLVEENNKGAAERIQATRGNDYILVYSANGLPFTVHAGKIQGDNLQSRWFNPRDGKSTPIEEAVNKGKHSFKPPSSGYGQDWILVIEAKK
jgi:hypothetical protein